MGIVGIAIGNRFASGCDTDIVICNGFVGNKIVQKLTLFSWAGSQQNNYYCDKNKVTTPASEWPLFVSPSKYYNQD